jgi:hypothetical protein
VHLIPALTFGVDVLKGKAQADIFINLDTSATLDVSAKGSIDIAKTLNARSTRLRRGSAGVRAARRLEETELVARQNLGAASADIEGCVAMGTGVSVNVGAKGQFFNFFNANTALALFKKDFQLFKVCLGHP